MIHNSCNMAIHDLPNMYALGLQAYVPGKSLMAVLQPLHVPSFTLLVNNLLFLYVAVLKRC